MEQISTHTDVNHNKKTRGVRELKRICSVQTLMPKVEEEGEDADGANTSRQRRTNSSPLIDSDVVIEPIKPEQQATSPSFNQPITALNARPNSLAHSKLPKHFYISTESKTFTHFDPLETSSTFHSQPIPDVCDGMMSYPVSDKQTVSNLLGVPQYFLTSAAPDLTQQSNDTESGVKDKTETVASSIHASSPDLLRVDTSPPDRELRACSVPANVNTKRTTPCEETEGGGNNSSKVFTNSDDSVHHSKPNRIFGRFSSTDESIISEQKGEELEAKFVYMTSTLSTQKVTIEKRVDISRHTRASAEESLLNEVNTLLGEIRVLVVKDTENKFKEELRNLEKRLQGVVPLSTYLANKAETYGAAKQEQKQLSAAESMVSYVEHVKRLHVRESSDHQATRLRLMKAQQDWNIGDMGDNSVNVNITRRSSTVGGSTQTLNKRRASVALAALPNILGGQGLKQLSMDPKSRFQQLVKRSSQSSHGAFRRPSQDSVSSDYTELPAVTVSKSPSCADSPAVPDCVTPTSMTPTGMTPTSMTPTANLTPRTSFSVADVISEQNNNANICTESSRGSSHLAVIKTISAVMPSVQTVEMEKPEKGEVRSTIRRKRSIKRTDMPGTQRNSLDHTPTLTNGPKEPDQLDLLIAKLDNHFGRHTLYRSCKERYQMFNKTHKGWKTQLRHTIFMAFLSIGYLQLRILLT